MTNGTMPLPPYSPGMLTNLALGTAMAAMTVFIHAIGLIALTSIIDTLFGRKPARREAIPRVVAIIVSASGVFVLLGGEIALWALFFLFLGAFDRFETALYFSTSTFATIGFGDISPAAEWRLLAAMEGVIGFLIVGWSSAYLVTSGIRFGPFERDKHF